MLEHSGFFWQAEGGAFAKVRVDELVRFELGLTDVFTSLMFDPKPGGPFWLNEVAAHAETQIGEQGAAMWLGLGYRLPVASVPGSPDPLNGRFLDPKVQLSLQIGGVITRNNWDLYAAYTVIDRGDLRARETTLPILDGGFDQQQLTIGVLHRFPRKRDPAIEWDLRLPE
jgi:hypothetical protein